MLNWNTDEEKFKKEDPEGYRRWRIVQMINYGMADDEKLDKAELKKLWPKIKDEIDPYLRRLTEYLLWGKLYSLPNNLMFWNWPPRNQK